MGGLHATAQQQRSTARQRWPLILALCAAAAAMVVAAPGGALASERIIVAFRPESEVGRELGSVGVAVLERRVAGLAGARRLYGGAPPAGARIGAARRAWLVLAATVVAPVGGSDNAAEIAHRLRARPDVLWAEVDGVVHAVDLTPTDPEFPAQWALHNEGQTGGTVDADIDAPAAWELTTGADQVVAVLDTGLDMQHPEMGGRIVSVPGADLVNDDSDPADDSGHGTHVAGIAAATGNNGAGIAGVCWSCRVMPIKVLDATATGAFSTVAEGIALAAANGASVINLSLGSATYSQSIQDAITAAIAGGAVVVGAAGNNGSSAPFYPAANEGVVAVAASDSNDGLASFSNRGDWVTVAGPGTDIVSTLPGGATGTWSGTSMAAPFVSGTAALVRAQHPDWDAFLVSAQLAHTADALVASGTGSGRINAYAALAATPEPDLVVAGVTVDDQDTGICPLCDGDGEADGGETVRLVTTLRNQYGDAAAVTGTLATESSLVTIDNNSSSFGAIAHGESATNASAPFQVTLAAAAAGQEIAFTIAATAGAGAPSEAPFTLALGARDVGGTISTDTLWEEGTVVRVSDPLTVASGARLTIEPGVRVLFPAMSKGQPVNLLVDGELVARGTRLAPIVFSEATPGAGWGSFSPYAPGIRFRAGHVAASFDSEGAYQSGSILEWCIVEKTGSSSTMPTSVEVDGTTPSPDGYVGPYIAHTVIRDGYLGLDTDDEPMRIENNAFYALATAVQLASFDQDPLPGGTFKGNLVGGPLYLFAGYAQVAATVSENTFVDRAGGVKYGYMATSTAVAPPLAGNNFAGVYGDGIGYAVNAPRVEVPELDAQGNYWGTTVSAEIAARIWDADDWFDRTSVDYTPFLDAPVRSAPGFVYRRTLDPPSPLSAEAVTLTIQLSRSMDTSVTPAVSFGLESPYADVVLTDPVWSTTEEANDTLGYAFEIVPATRDGTHTLRISGAVDASGFLLLDDESFQFVIDTPVGIARGVAVGYGLYRAPNGASAGRRAGNVDAFVSWQPLEEDDLGGYTVRWGSSAGNLPFTADAGLSTSAIVPDLSPGTTYCFAVQTRETDGDPGPTTEAVCKTTAPEFKVPAPGLPAWALVAPGLAWAWARARAQGLERRRRRPRRHRLIDNS
ncbi:MAG: S8 family serine peptidase [Candidatus Schekmanbacteria bacterium]|nr:S8 family serine peptidase [Candidatus Schekmanbacteria bacterium]